MILRVPEDAYLPLAPRDRVRFLSGYARQALIASAALRGVALAPEALFQEASGRPEPLPAGYWSVSHKPSYVAGVFSPEPVGIDIERIRTYSIRLRAKTADAAEWGLVDPELPESFFRFWTAKEAVLKIGGAGIAHLLQCRVIRIEGRHRLRVRYREAEYRICHGYFDDHVAAVVEGALPIQWRLPEDPSGSA